MLGVVFGMSNTQATPPSTAARVPVGIELDRRVARVAQMHVRVHQPRQHVQPARVERLLGRVRAETANGRDPPGAHGDVRPLLAPGQDERAAADDQVVVHRETSGMRKVRAGRSVGLMPPTLGNCGRMGEYPGA